MKYKDKIKIINNSVGLFLVVTGFLLILTKLDEVEKTALESKIKIQILESNLLELKNKN